MGWKKNKNFKIWNYKLKQICWLFVFVSLQKIYLFLNLNYIIHVCSLIKCENHIFKIFYLMRSNWLFKRLELVMLLAELIWSLESWFWTDIEFIWNLESWIAIELKRVVRFVAGEGRWQSISENCQFQFHFHFFI